MTQLVKKDLEEIVEKPILDVHRNSFGVSIVKCCMSCDHKDINARGDRHCVLSKTLIDRYGLCDCWVLSKGLEVAGKSNGRVDIHCHDKFLQRSGKITELLSE